MNRLLQDLIDSDFSEDDKAFILFVYYVNDEQPVEVASKVLPVQRVCELVNNALNSNGGISVPTEFGISLIPPSILTKGFIHIMVLGEEESWYFDVSQQLQKNNIELKDSVRDRVLEKYRTENLSPEETVERLKEN